MDFIEREAGTWFWYIRTQEELDQMAARDRESGDVLDAAGEPRLYAKVGSRMFKEATIVAVTRRRKVPWPHWTRKPKYLVEGLATVGGVPRLVLITDPPWVQSLTEK